MWKKGDELFTFDKNSGWLTKKDENTIKYEMMKQIKETTQYKSIDELNTI